MNEIALLSIDAGDGDGAGLVFDYNDKRISISVFPSTFQPLSDGQSDKHGCLAGNCLVDLLGRAVSTENDEEYEEVTDEALDIILDAGKILFAETRFRPSATQPTKELHSLLYPELLFFRLLTSSGKVSLTPIDPKEAYACRGLVPNADPTSNVTIKDGLPRYSTKEIIIEEIFLRGEEGIACRVLVDSEVMFCKAWSAGLSNLQLERELAKLQKIRDADLHKRLPIRVPRLLGYVTHPEAGCVLGLLREWLPGRRLEAIDISAIPEQRRRKWASQTRETVEQLRKIGVTWGEGRVRSIIVDTDDDAWLIGLAGRQAEDEELANTVEGHKQAVGRVMRFLGFEKGYI